MSLPDFILILVTSHAYNRDEILKRAIMAEPKTEEFMVDSAIQELLDQNLIARDYDGTYQLI